MNERIKEIAKDAGVLGDWGENASEGRFFITGNTKQMEKFALLIVRECISVYERDPSVYHEVNIANILEHFGVE